MRRIITSRRDIDTYVTDAHPDLCEHGLRDQLVTEIQVAHHPPYGQDWEQWLDRNVDQLRARVAGPAQEPWDESVGILTPRETQTEPQTWVVDRLYAAAPSADVERVRRFGMQHRWLAYSITSLARLVLSCCETAGECADVQLYVNGVPTKDRDDTDLHFQAEIVRMTDRHGKPLPKQAEPLQLYRIVTSEGVDLGRYEGTSPFDALDAMAVDGGFHSQQDALHRGCRPFRGTVQLVDPSADGPTQEPRPDESKNGNSVLTLDYLSNRVDEAEQRAAAAGTGDKAAAHAVRDALLALYRAAMADADPKVVSGHLRPHRNTAM